MIIDPLLCMGGELKAIPMRGTEVIFFNVPGDDIMHFTDCCRFLISSSFKFTALCTILSHCVGRILPHWGLEGGGGMGIETSHVLSH